MTTDLEGRLRAALAEESEAAPTATGLAASARGRLRRRRQVRAWTAAVVVLALVPVGLVALLRGTSPVAPSASGTAAVDGGWQTLTTGDLQLQVPASWVEGGPSTWCRDGRTPEDVTPVYELPSTSVPGTGCASPAQGYGVVVSVADFLGSGTDPARATEYDWSAPSGRERAFPDRSWVAGASTGDLHLIVVAGDRATAEAVAASLRRTTPIAGWKSIAWKGWTLSVPSSWTEGGPGAWCADSRSLEDATPAYELPGTLVPAIGCGSPRTGYGLMVTFPFSVAADHGPAHEYRWLGRRAAHRLFPDRSWVQVVDWAGGTLTIVTADRRTTEEIAASVR